jgi:twitching motility protein PilJ
MNGTPSTTSENLSSHQSESGWGNRLKNLFATRVIETVSVALLLTLALFGVSSWTIWNIYQGFREKVTEQFRLKELIGNATYHDESLGLGAYMYVTTGESQWLDYYKRAEPLLNATIEELIQISPQAKADFTQTEAATAKLYELEVQAFELVRQGKKEGAQKIVFGQEYGEQRQLYAAGIEKTLTNLETSVDKELESYRQGLFQSLIFAGVSLPLLVLAWLIILSAVRTYIQERDKAQKGLMESQASLQQLNEELEGRVEQRTQQLAAQEQATREESEVLQEDVVNLLDVVSEVEGGNLTVQASVSDRITGLVADTFNRLTEELSKVLAQVVGSTRQVAQSSQQLDESAQTVALNAQQQAQEISKVLELTQQVQRSARESAEQTELSNQSLAQVQAAIAQGKLAIDTLTQEIQTLQAGTDIVTRRTQDLDKFVDVTEQFVQEQGQLAELIQSLAMSATLLSARATAQQDPRQMMVVAKEFETIAGQIKGLAEQTYKNLRTLQKRTDEIQGTVSLITQDIQGIGGLVSGFTMGVKQSRQAFGGIESATTEVVKTGQAVAQSSQEIATTAQSTAKAMGDIARLAEQTAQLTQTAQTQSASMGQISEQLLQRIEFFRLPAEAMQRADLSQAQESTVDVTPTPTTT